MKLIKSMVFCAALALVGSARAQDAPPRTWVLDVAAGRIFHAGQVLDAPTYYRSQLSAAGWHYWSIGPRGRLRLGTGLRLTHGWAPDIELSLKDIKPFDGVYGPENPGSLSVAGLEITALNLALAAQWRPLSWLHAGFNIDAAGLPIRSRGRGTFAFSYAPPDTTSHDFNGYHYRPAPNARAQRGNLLLVAQRDRGFLNSEFYVGTTIGSIDLRVGASHIATTFIAEGRRFQAFQTLGFVGLSYQL